MIMIVSIVLVLCIVSISIVFTIT